MQTVCLFPTSSRCTGAFHGRSPKPVFLPHQHHAAITKPLILFLLWAVLMTHWLQYRNTRSNKICSQVSREGNQEGGTVVWPSSGWLVTFFRDIGPSEQVPHGFLGALGCSLDSSCSQLFPPHCVSTVFTVVLGKPVSCFCRKQNELESSSQTQTSSNVEMSTSGIWLRAISYFYLPMAVFLQTWQ